MRPISDTACARRSEGSAPSATRAAVATARAACDNVIVSSTARPDIASKDNCPES
jgi:hypothetical protein